MDTNTLPFISKLPKDESGQDLFRHYARPLTARLLEAMELAKSFYHGEGDYLYYNKNGKHQRVLDLTGGYGANLLGHRHPRLLNKVREWSEEGSPNHTQGSVRASSGLLAARISSILQQETGEGPWVTTFSNSGTEAIEAAIKHCYIYFQHKVTELNQEIEKEINLAQLRLRTLSEADQLKKVRELKTDLSNRIEHLKMNEERKSYFLHQLNNVHNLGDLVELIRLINGLQISQKPVLIALDKAFHGKTMGSLALTSNATFRQSFYLGEDSGSNSIFISQYQDPAKLDELIKSLQQDLVVLSCSLNTVVVLKQSFSKVAGAFVEPIQGEAGVVPVSPEFLANIKKHSLQEDFQLVFDEIQSGMFRTGKLSAATHHSITADIYTFSKSLGGGVAKIAATSINQRRYVEEFGYLHTSTLSDDDFSSLMGLEVLEILLGENSPLAQGMRVADYLEARLSWLKEQFPEIIKEVRGRGLMMAIEFNDILKELGFELKSVCDARMQGYMMASALLNHENIRMSPSLSNNLTLRIQPSIYITIVQIEEMMIGLMRLCDALQKRDLSYFLTALYPEENILNEKTRDVQDLIEPGKRPISVFLCHLIDEGHIRKVTKALKNVPGQKILKKLALSKDVAQFSVYHVQTIVDKNGKEMDIVMLGIPVTSEELKKTFVSKNRYKIVQKVQAAVDFSKSIGANTVGLGQFTSIVSGNGLYLNSRGMNLTTGNAFTISLTVQSALRSAEEKKINLAESTAILIGAAGNIMSVATSLMADQVGKIIMLHHSPIESSLKYQEATRRILDEIASSSANTKVVQAIKSHWSQDSDLISFLSLPEIKDVFVASASVTDIKEADIVMCGASASNGFLSLDIFKENAVVVDVAVPPTIKPELLSKIHTERPDLTYHLGGVAQIPKDQSIDFFILPLEKNECYACMAETFSLGFHGPGNFVNIGDLNKAVVTEVTRLAEEAGFILGSYKNKSSL